MLSILNSYSHGYVAVPVIGACRRHGWLERLDLSAGNAGFLRVALHMFESLGWGREAAAKSAALPDEADALYGVPFAELFTRPESRALLGRTARALASCETTRLFDGAVMLPLLIALKQGSATLADLDDDVCALLRRNGLLERNAWTELGTQLIDRAYVMAIAGSYRPMLARMDELLFGDAASVFAEDPVTGESHVDRRLNVVASGMQHERYFRDAEERVLEIFNRMPVEAQPRALADMGCGDGSFLRQLYLAIRDRSERGKRLREHPLTLVGVDYNEAALIETRRTLEDLPFVTLAGDINDPQRLLRDLDAIGIDPKGVLHLRSFLDHNFRYAPPDDEAEEFSLTPGGVHVDADGAPVPPQQLLRAWAAHLRRWASVVNEHGLILLESHCLSPEMTQLHFDVAENFYFDALHGFSRQYLIDAESFLVVAASTGLFPKAQPKRYPKTLPFCRITLSHLEKRDYAVRQARLADVDALVRLETLCWPEELRASRAELQSRVERNPEGQFVVDCDGAVAAVIYSQRIESIDVLRDATVDRVADLHRAGGPVVQLLAVNVDPARQERNLGDQLLEFMLQRCSVMNGVTSVAGVTRCRDYGKQRDVAIEDYIRTRDAHGALADPILRFHELHGATVETLVGDYRPADVANEGCGVLIAYDLRNRERGGPRVARAAHASAGAFVEQAIRRILGNTREAAFAPDRPLMEMGLDSIDLLELHTQIQQQYALDLTPTFFFQANTAEKIRAFIEPRQQKVLVTPRNSEEPRGTQGTAVDGIAIIGIACRLPGGVDDLETLWTLLKEGKSAIGDLPPGRFSWPAGIEPDGAHRGIARGGFIADVDRFDAPFFRISPKEAECMDPQQRIVMELAWQALEDAGYAAQSLAGSPTSVYIGASGSDYARLLDQSGYDPTAHSGTGGSMAVLANRISYFFDFHGPSLQIDTACSSSLVAVHEAMQSLRAGESTMALVGGVHLIAHPANSIIYYKAGMLSKDGRCKTFDQSANGYVRAEGAAMLLLKPAAQAIEDGDRIHAILRGSATNHGGLASGLTVPHPERQAKLLTAAWRAAGVAPESLTYVEAHGTGTSLGDPIEVQGLSEAFAGRGRCGIGSIKTNVGHLEAAAGLAGLLKVVASLQHRQLPPTLHCDVVNPHIELGESLEIVRELRPWTARDGVRRAGVSSFGSGGTNAHVVLEEFVAPAARSGTVLPSLFVLSAKNDERLRAYVERILSWLSSNATCAFDDLIFTYQTGRQAMDERLAIVASSTDELRQKLAAHLAGEPVPDLFRENVTRLPVATKTLMSGEAAEALRRIALKNRDLRSLAVLWTSGVAIDWRSLYGELPHRITVPAYPFARERHWIARAHPLLDANLRTTFRRDDVFLRDHVVDGHVILPGVAHLEMARAAAGEPVAGFRDVFWGRPLLAGERSETACVRLTSNAFTIHRDGHPSFVFSQGTIERESTVRAAQFDLDEIRSRLPVRKSKAETFDHLTRLGFAYGPWFQRSEELHSGEREALVRMRMPRDEWPASAWHPALMDTALRASFLIGLDQNALNDHLRVPFSLGAARQFAPFPERCWAYARVAQLQKDGDPITDVSILDEDGVEVFRFERFFAKRFQRATDEQAVHFYRPVWRADEGRRSTASVAVETAASLPEVVDRVRELLSRETRPATRILAATSDAAIAGLAKAMPGIAPEVSIVTIDADDPAEGLRRERELDTPGGTEVRYRNGERLVRGLERIEKPHDGTSAFRRHGCYLITGAMGGLGFQTASYLAKHYAADLILIGRSAPDAAKLEALRAHAQSVEYLRADVAGIAALPDRRIDGVLHCAGVAGDVFTAGTTREDFERAMHAKVQGTLHLHELTKDQPLQFFVLFSSIASLLGDFSRGSYAAANRFLDAFAESRKGPGKTLSINWPYWQDGGFSKEFFRDEHNERAYFQQSGFTPLTTAAGMSVLESALRFEGSQVVVATGDREKIEHALGVPAPARVPRSSSAFLGSSEVLGREPAHRGTRGTPRNAEELSREVETYLIRQIAVATGLAESRIGVEESLGNYGIESMIIMDLNRRLQADFASLPGTLFFEFNTVRDLARYFVENRADELRVVLRDVAAVEPMAPAQTLPVQAPALRSASAKSRDVAIIGMSGRYPMARNLDELWANLRDGRDCIETIPAERWDWRAYFQPEHPQPGQTNSKWGGFIADVDKFDPLFFGISPREARYIDPQQRLFAEVVWEACEDACYRWDRNSNKAELPKENDVGVFIGSMYDDYQFLEKEISTSYWNSFIANRVSYFFNFRGPSITVDTACSSSLTAIQMAYENVRNGQCYAAVAGGTNLSIHPNKYSRLTQLNLLSSEGKCRSFGAGGNGYVPGEGVGAILLKRLEDAERDGDRIYAVIKGGALNHGGKTNGLTVPNPNAQAALVADALRDSGIDPRRISYIEAHGTGTSLGDPIEVAGLTKAFRQHTGDAQFCAIGSVKSNVGHLEGAAGVVAVQKVVLQMLHGQLVPSLHSETLNPIIDFAQSPFRVQRELAEWKGPRIAGISSFGAGGSNAHLILEEYVAPPRVASDVRGPFAVPLSARNADRLRAYAGRLLAFLERTDAAPADVESRLRALLAQLLSVAEHEIDADAALSDYGVDDLQRLRILDVLRDACAVEVETSAFLQRNTLGEILSLIGARDFTIADVAHSLQIGREPMAERIELYASSIEELRDRLRQWLATGALSARPSFVDTPAHARKISLPTYPFARETYWVPDADVVPRSASVPRSSSERAPSHAEELRGTRGTDALPSPHPLLAANVSTFEGQRFRTTLRGGESVLADHVIGGKKILPAVAYLETARAGGEIAGNAAVTRISDVVFARPIVVADEAVEIDLELRADGEAARFSVRDAHRGLYAQGRLSYASIAPAETRDVQAIEARCGEPLDGADCYAAFAEKHFGYGPSFRCVRRLWRNDSECLALLEPASAFDGFQLHPGLLDSALQGSILLSGDGSSSPYVPYSLGALEMHAPVGDRCYSHVRLRDDARAGETSVDVEILAEDGRLLARIENLALRAAMRESRAAERFHYRPAWIASPLEPVPSKRPDAPLLVFTHDAAAWDDDAIRVRPGAAFRERGRNEYELHPANAGDYVALLRALDERGIRPGSIVHAWPADPFATDGVEAQLRHGLESMFHLTRALVARREKDIRLLYVFTEESLDAEPLHAAMAGFFRSVNHETPGLVCRTLALEPGANVADAVRRELAPERFEERHVEIRHRDGQRWVMDLQRVELAAEAPPLKQGGVYLITGGAGGLGLVFAKHLAEQWNARVILAGRSALSDEKAALVRAIAGDVRYERCDLTSRADVDSLIASIKSRHGRIDGIVHAAGIARNAYLRDKTREQLDAVIAPKVFGAIHLHEATGNERLDFFALFSSISAVVEIVGQSDYSFANRFLDAFAAWRNRRGFGRTLSIDWPLWKDGGMHVDRESEAYLQSSMGMELFASEAGGEELERMLGSDESQLLVVAGDARKIERALVKTRPRRAAPPPPMVEDDFSAFRNEMLQKVSTFLEMEPAQVEPETELMAYGVDSINSTALTNEINRDYDLELPPSVLFEYPTVASFSRHVYETVRREHVDETARLPIRRVAVPAAEHPPELLPLTHGQRALWFLHQLAPESCAYHIAMPFRIVSPLDVEVFRDSFQLLVNRHPALRTGFRSRGGEPVQEVHASGAVAFETYDASGWSDETLHAAVRAAYEKPFDLEAPALLRVALFTRAASDHVCLITVHHIVSDAWSIWTLMRELGECHAALLAGREAVLPPLEATYGDFLAAQGSMLRSSEGAAHGQYWQRTLAGELPVLNLPIDRARPKAQTFDGASQHFVLSEDLSARVVALAARERATPFMILLAAYQVLLHRYSGDGVVMVGSPASGRAEARFNDVIGYFVNPVVLRGDLSADPAFRDFLQQTRGTVLEALQHQSYPFPLLVELLGPDRYNGRTPLFQAELVFQKAQGRGDLMTFLSHDPTLRTQLGGLELMSYPFAQQEGQFDLTLELMEIGRSFSGSLKYNRDLFTPDTIERMSGHFRALLEAIVSVPDARISELALITERERKVIRDDWNRTATPCSKTPMHRLFEEQVRRHPEKPAVRFGDDHLTYRELNARANRLARHLRDAGVDAESIAGIHLPRSLDLLVGLLAVMKAGGAYIPMDPSYPAARLERMLEHAAPRVLVTRSDAPRLDAHGALVIAIDDEAARIDAQSPENLDVDPAPESAAYVIYTSGSTGDPKGVLVPHGALTNFLGAMQSRLGFEETAHLLSVTTVSFDIAALELYLPLICGASLTIAGSDAAADGASLMELLARGGITAMQATPATWQMLLASGWKGAPGLAIYCGGEALPRALAEQLLDRGAAVWNLYGPTETTIWSSLARVTRGLHPRLAVASIGRPIDNTTLYVLDRSLALVPPGVVGDLYIGGDGLARGYVHRPDLTAERFVADPFGSGGRLYRTGDLARYLPDGQIEFAGRGDQQLKIRGFRIELGEIEAALRKHEGIAEPVVVARGNGAAKTLVAYFTARAGFDPRPKELRERLSVTLPEYMVPSAFVKLDKLPLTLNNKVDRRALPDPDRSSFTIDSAYVAPATRTQQELAELWTGLLACDRIGIHDRFFDIGGNSMLAAKLVFQIHDRFGVQLPVSFLFEYPTVDGLARAIDARRETNALDDAELLRIFDRLQNDELDVDEARFLTGA